MNAYGFGGGDRVNYSDPLGLAPCTENETSSGKETMANKGGAVCVEGRNRKAQVCIARTTHFATFAVMDATTVIGVGGVARASFNLAGKTLESALSSALKVGEKAAARGVLDASGHLVQTTALVGASIGKGAPVNVGNTVAETGGISLRDIAQSFIPFDGTGERMSKAIEACAGDGR